MGIIRKTASIATLGLVNWRSTKEKLAEERLVRQHLEGALSDTTETLERSRRATRAARRREAKAQKRAVKAELEQLKLAKKAERRRRFGRWRRDAAHSSGQVRGGLRILRFFGRRASKRAAAQTTDAVRSAQDALPV